MFTPEDINVIAIQIEKNAEAGYRQAAEKTSNSEVAKILLWLAEQEQLHAQWFTNLVHLPQKANNNPQLLQLGQDLLLSTMQNQTFSLDPSEMAQESSVQAVLLKSIELENDTILFYDMLCGFIDSPHGVAQLEAIISEERNHIEIIEKMLEKI